MAYFYPFSGPLYRCSVFTLPSELRPKYPPLIGPSWHYSQPGKVYPRFPDWVPEKGSKLVGFNFLSVEFSRSVSEPDNDFTPCNEPSDVSASKNHFNNPFCVRTWPLRSKRFVFGLTQGESGVCPDSVFWDKHTRIVMIFKIIYQGMIDCYMPNKT